MNLAFTFSCMMAVVWLMCGECETAAELVTNHRQRIHKRPLLRGFSVEDLLEEEEDENLELRKRQHFDDYGHLRFGKREHFDDYGHLRFGRNHE